jgi:regulator of replication initiation timing/histone H3/H4
MSTRNKSVLCSECRLDKSNLIGESENASGSALHDVIEASSVDGSATITEAMMNKICSKVIDGLSKSLKTMIADEFSALRAEIDGMKTSVSYLSGEYDILKEKLDKLCDENNHLKSKVSELERKGLDIGATLKSHNEDVNSREQAAKLYNVEIKGVRESNNESLSNIIESILRVTGCDIDMREVDYIVRTRTRENNAPKPIIVKFLRKITRDTFLACVRNKKRTITTRDIGVIGSPNDILINEHLTLRNKQLFFEAHKLKRELSYKYAWTRNGKIYMRKSEGSRRLYVSSMADLANIKQNCGKVFETGPTKAGSQQEAEMERSKV